MIASIFFKFGIVFALLAFVCANNAEAELEQPTKLLGGILRRSDQCKHKVGSNSKIKLHYRARVWGEKEFYENTYTGEPQGFKLGRDKMMKGLEQGIDGMCAGEVRRLLIPADLAYGEVGIPGLVPANTAVIYEVEILDVNSPFSNPWFWAGLIALGFAFVILNRYTRMKETSKTAKFLEKKEQEKKSE